MTAIAGTWSAQGTPVSIAVGDDGTLLVDMSAYGRPPASGKILDAATIVVTFPDDDTFTGNLVTCIEWSNATTWDKPAVADGIAGEWSAQGTPVVITVGDDNALLVDMSAYGRPMATGKILDAATIVVTFPDDDTFTGQVVTRIEWSNATTWEKPANVIPSEPEDSAEKTPEPRIATDASVPVQISFIHAHAAKDDPAGEYVCVKNTTDQPVDLTGWTLRDLASHVYHFPTFTLAAGAEVQVWSTKGENDATNLYWGYGRPIWNNTGDVAILRNAQDVEVVRYDYVGEKKPASN